jgi:hypothetical protein
MSLVHYLSRDVWIAGEEALNLGAALWCQFTRGIGLQVRVRDGKLWPA